MNLHLSNDQIKSITDTIRVKDFPKMSLTVGGNVVIILCECDNNTHPLLGAYFTSDDPDDGDWITTRWTSEGKHSYGDGHSKLDLVQEQTNEAA